jgi:hypothetical protein
MESEVKSEAEKVKPFGPTAGLKLVAMFNDDPDVRQIAALAGARIAQLIEGLDAVESVLHSMQSRLERETRYMDDEHINPAIKALEHLIEDGLHYVREALSAPASTDQNEGNG